MNGNLCSHWRTCRHRHCRAYRLDLARFEPRPGNWDWQADRWIEAVLGARLRFHAQAMNDAGLGPELVRMYQRWQRIYHAGKAGILASEVES